mgnify:CR=1 FL=1
MMLLDNTNMMKNGDKNMMLIDEGNIELNHEIFYTNVEKMC